MDRAKNDLRHSTIAAPRIARILLSESAREGILIDPPGPPENSHDRNSHGRIIRNDPRRRRRFSMLDAPEHILRVGEEALAKCIAD
jgi:hypothetical protein